MCSLHSGYLNRRERIDESKTPKSDELCRWCFVVGVVLIFFPTDGLFAQFSLYLSVSFLSRLLLFAFVVLHSNDADGRIILRGSLALRLGHFSSSRNSKILRTPWFTKCFLRYGKSQLNRLFCIFSSIQLRNKFDSVI